MENMSNWIEHLQHPLVLIGFVLFTLTSLVRWLKPEKLSGTATERLFGRGLNYFFILSLLVIAAGVFLNLPATAPQPPQQSTSVTQQTEGESSPAVSSGGDVNINYGGTLETNEKQPPSKSEPDPAPPQKVEQTTQGDKSPAINSQGDANINYGQ